MILGIQNSKDPIVVSYVPSYCHKDLEKTLLLKKKNTCPLRWRITVFLHSSVQQYPINGKQSLRTLLAVSLHTKTVDVMAPRLIALDVFMSTTME